MDDEVCITNRSAITARGGLSGGDEQSVQGWWEIRTRAAAHHSNGLRC